MRLRIAVFAAPRVREEGVDWRNDHHFVLG